MSKLSIDKKTYTLPDINGYIATGVKADIGKTNIPVYMKDGKLQPITSYDGNAKSATKVYMDRISNPDTCYLTGSTSASYGRKDLKIVPTVYATLGGPMTDVHKQTVLNVGNDNKNQGVLRLYDGKDKGFCGTIFLNKLSEPREYYLPNADGTFAIISDGNDIAEFRVGQGSILPGRVVQEVGDGTLKIASERLARGCEIVSDTYSFSIGEDDTTNLPIALTGRVLAYPDKDASTFEIGAPVCAGENGTVSQMTEEEERMYPSRILGTVSEIPTYGVWSEGNKNIPVQGRIWIRVR